MRSLRILPSLALGLGILASSSLAFANKGGVTGSSGKNGTGTCTGCHGTTGGQPTITANFPENVKANDTFSLTLTVTGPGSTSGFDGAFDNDVIVTPGSGAIGANNKNELTHSTPMAATGTWTFMVKVPNRNGILSLWVAAVSGNGDNTDNGDGVGTQVFTAAITGSDAGVTEPPADDPTTDPGTGNGATSSTVDAGPPVIIPHPILPDGDPGCQLAPGRTPDVLAMAGIGAVILGLRRRTNRRRRGSNLR